MILEFEKTEFNLGNQYQARKKFENCHHSEKFFGCGCCKLFNYTMEKGMDFMVYCGNCKANTAEPSTARKDVRKT